jgi:acrylyl-CoA reductase (NADPH)
MEGRLRAIVVRDANAAPALEHLPEDLLPDGDVLVDVRYSTLNYKDGLALHDPKKVIRRFPMVPGIDFSGVILESRHAAYQPGDAVVLTGWGVGERHWGGFAERARVPGDWLVPLPRGLSLAHAMTIGTAGFTAMLAVMALEHHGLVPGGVHPVAVTGAAGGVGSMAVAILASAGHRVAAVTGREHEGAYLRELGAAEVVGREVLAVDPAKPLQSERWAGAIDAVGGAPLASLLASMAAGSSIAVCGLAAGAALNTTVLPLILRGVNLLGIHSVTVPLPTRLEAWRRLADTLSPSVLDLMSRTVPLDDVIDEGRRILDGQVRGRLVVVTARPAGT